MYNIMSKLNNWKSFLNFTKTGVDLGDFLSPAKQKALKGYRVFYIVRSVAEPNVIKFGISDGAGYSRLNSYRISYGGRSKNRCTGVDLLYLAGVRQHEHVAWVNSVVYKMEKSLKDNLKTISDRGDERTRESLDTIKTAMLKNKSEDTVVKPRRNEQRNTIKVDDRVNYKWDKVNFKEEWFGKTLKAKVIKVNSTTVTLKFSDGTILERAQKSKVLES